MPGDIAVASVHWGANWGYNVSAEAIEFAHALIDLAGVDIVFGHSSHHAKAIEVHKERIILYGCGDFIDDYEGIGGHEAYRDDLVLMYFIDVRRHDGRLDRLTMVPRRVHDFRLNRASPREAAWLHDTLDRESQRFGTRILRERDNVLTLALD